MTGRYVPILLTMFALLGGCQSCTSSTDNLPPTVVLSGQPSGAFVVGDTLLIGIDANDPEGGSLTFDWDHKPKERMWTVKDRSEFVVGTTTATFQWDPLASDATNGEPIQLIFIVTDDSGQSTEKTVTIEITPGNGIPTFRSNASELYDPRSGKPLEFEVRVTDNDSTQVTLDVEKATQPAGSNFNQDGPFTGKFSWMPSAEQLNRRVHNVTFTANDNVNPVVTFKVTIVVRAASEVIIDKDQTNQECPSASVIQHVPLGPQRSGVEGYPIEVTLADPRFDEVILYFSISNPMGSDFDPSMDELASVPLEDQGGTWVGEIAPQIGQINPEIGAVAVYYQLCAFDNDASGANAIVCAPSSGDLELWNVFTAYLPDRAECVDDALSRSSVPNDSAETAGVITEGWSEFNACGGVDDFHSVTLRAGETALVAAVYPQGEAITFAGYDQAQNPIEVKKSNCTGMATMEVSVPSDGAQSTFYLKASGNDVPYVVKAFKSGNPSECADAANEPNDDASQATPAMDGSMFSAEICNGSDLDVYSIPLSAGDNITVTTSFANSMGNLDMTLFPPSQAGEVSSSGTGVKFTFSFDDTETLQYTAEESGTYYLLVFNNEASSNRYTISFDVGAAPPCPDQDTYSSASPNHSKATAALIPSTDGDHTLPALEVCPGAPDWYKRTEFTGAFVFGTVTVTGGTGSINDVAVKVFDEADNQVGTGVVSGNAVEFEYTPQATGVHYIKVETTSRVTYDLGIIR